MGRTPVDRRAISGYPLIILELSSLGTHVGLGAQETDRWIHQQSAGYVILPPTNRHRRRVDDLVDLISHDADDNPQAASPSQGVGRSAPTSEPESGVSCPDDLLAQPVARNWSFAAFDSDGTPITWRHGQTITVALAPADMAYPHFVRDAHGAIKRINLVGAFALRLIGHDGARLDEADITIRWGEPLRGPTGRRWAGMASLATSRPSTHRFICHADVYLNPRRKQGAGLSRGSWGTTMLHELMHALGAGHCSDPQQIMHPTSGKASDLGTGDRYCLKLLAEAARQQAGMTRS